jgi:hypothetical protein
MIRLEGLTEKQLAIARLLWSTETKEEVELYCKVNPEIRVVYEMMVAAMMDTFTDTDLADEVMSNIMGLK